MSNIERPFLDADFPHLFDLLIACQAAGYVDMELLSTNLRLTLTNPDFDRSDTFLLESDERLEAFALLWQGRYLGMLVHPSLRGRLEAQAVAWAERQVTISAVQAPLVILCRDDDELLRGFCEERGYDIFDEELRMGRSLLTPLPEFAPPAGIVIRPRRGDAEFDAWLALYTEALGPRPAKLRHWRAMRDDPDYESSLDLVAVTDDGRLAGFCFCSIAGVEAASARVVEGRTEPVAVGRDFQRKGLARALISAGLATLREHGAQSAALTTEVENANAHRLYAALGYRELYRVRWYRT
ncbi:MAG TPA: GNAT family N-acetyltransferase [Thermomicrobiales bacterium]|nr:GNAT family N-acetyltransferase [Thermomicrobiales bacterium]